MKRLLLVFYTIIFASVVALDRLSKAWALKYLEVPQEFNKYISFDLSINRGISWSMFHTENDARFLLLTAMIIGIIIVLIAYTYKRYSETSFIFGETLVLAGALSNLTDRFVYQGVIDFIVVQYQDFVWPTFNIADASIVFGVCIMLISVYRKA